MEIWNNKFIKIDSKPTLYKNWYHVGIKTIGDLLSDKVQLLTVEELPSKCVTL